MEKTTHDKTYTLEEEIEAFQKLKREPDNIILRNDIVSHNLGLVKVIANGYVNNSANTSLSYDDLLMAGIEGLIKAIKKYDLSVGTKFSTYAIHWINQVISRAIQNESRTIRIPVHMYEKYGQIKSASERLIKELGREPTLEEVAKSLNISAQKIQEIKNSLDNTNIVSLDFPIVTDKISFLGDFIPSDEEDFTSKIDETNSRNESIRLIISYFLLGDARNIRQIVICMLSFGIISGEEMTLELVGEVFGLTHERIRQIQLKVLKKMKTLIYSKDEYTVNPKLIDNKQLKNFSKLTDEKFKENLHMLSKINIYDAIVYALTCGYYGIPKTEEEIIKVLPIPKQYNDSHENRVLYIKDLKRDIKANIHNKCRTK